MQNNFITLKKLVYLQYIGYVCFLLFFVCYSSLAYGLGVVMNCTALCFCKSLKNR